jgi:hypothetical protein
VVFPAKKTSSSNGFFFLLQFKPVGDHKTKVWEEKKKIEARFEPAKKKKRVSPIYFRFNAYQRDQKLIQGSFVRISKRIQVNPYKPSRLVRKSSSKVSSERLNGELKWKSENI